MRLKWLTGIVLALVLALGIAYFLRRPPPPRSLTLATATSGGSYIKLGRRLARIIEEHPGQSIGEVKDSPSTSGMDNVDRLLNGSADIALLLDAQAIDHDIRVLAKLGTDVIQVVARRPASKQATSRPAQRPKMRLSDLQGKRVFVGTDIKEKDPGLLTTKVLAAGGASSFSKETTDTYDKAADQLIRGTLDAAVFLATTPVDAVARVMSSGCCELLDLEVERKAIRSSMPGLRPITIPGNVYKNQPRTVHSFEADFVLASRRDLDQRVVMEILDALFDDLDQLSTMEINAQNIRMDRAFDDLPKGLTLHPAARTFQHEQKGVLRIATASLTGWYYNLGKRMQLVLERSGIPARTIQSDGSLENARLLAGEEPTIALMQYDTAIKSYWFDNDGNQGQKKIKQVKGLRRILSAQEEALHVVMRRDRLPAGLGKRATLDALKDRTICLGPELSGTALLAREVIEHHDVTPRRQLHLSVRDMLAWMRSGEVDAGFVVSRVPSEMHLLRAFLDDENFRLLAVEPPKLTNLLGSDVHVTRIKPGTYRSQRPDEAAIDAVATRGLLVTTKDAPIDVHAVTRALFEAAAFLRIKGGPKAMARSTPSLPLHPEAKRYYEEAGYLPQAPARLERFAMIWYLLAIIATLIAIFEVGHRILRIRSRDMFINQILSTDTGSPGALDELIDIQRKVREQFLKSWWNPRDLGAGQLRELETLLVAQMVEAREYLESALLQQIREAKDDDPATNSSLEQRLWSSLQSGKLSASQYELMTRLLHREF